MFQVYLAEHRGSTNWGDRKSNQRKSNQIKCWFLVGFMASEDLTGLGLANELNEFFTSVGSITAQKARDLTLHHGLNINLDVPTPLHNFYIYQC